MQSSRMKPRISPSESRVESQLGGSGCCAMYSQAFSETDSDETGRYPYIRGSAPIPRTVNSATFQPRGVLIEPSGTSPYLRNTRIRNFTACELFAWHGDGLRRGRGRWRSRLD